jgi:hypothetical protein
MRLKILSPGLRACRAIVASAAVLLLLFPVMLGAAPRADEFGMSIVGLRYDPAERVSKFDFKISGGQVVGLPRVPMGWTLSISNDPSWSSEVSGTAIVGAAFIQPRQFVRKIVTIRTTPDELKRYPGAPQITKVTGYVELYKLDDTRRVTLANDDFAMSPR